MAVSASVLRELHRVHCQLADLHDRLESGPRQLRAREASLAALESTAEENRETVKQTKLAIDQKQLDLKAGENKIDDLKAKLNGASSNKEYQSLLEQIAASEMANSVLADEILEAMEKCDQLEIGVGESEQTVEAAKTQLTEAREKFASESKLIQADIDRLEIDRTGLEKQLPAEMKVDYERVIRNKGSDGMSVCKDGVCLACGGVVTLNMQNELMLSKPIFCKRCGCVLYLEEE